MAEFPVFQSVGPQVDVQLFGQAAETGVNLGKSLPNPITSVIEGGIQGYKTGQEIALKQAQIDNEQSVAKINALTADRDTQLQGTQLKEQEAQLEDQTTRYTQDNQVRQKEQDFLQAFQSADAATQKQMIFSGQNAALFAQNPTLFKNIGQQLAFNPDLSPAEQTELNRLLHVANIYDYGQKAAQRDLPNFLKAQSDLFEGTGKDFVNSTSNQLKIPRENVADNVKFVPSGSLKIDKSGYVAMGPDLQPILGDPEDQKTLRGRYDAISTAPGSEGLVVGRELDGKVRNSVENYITHRGVQTGIQTQYALNYGQKNGTQVQGQGANVNTFNQPREVQFQDPFKVAVERDLGTTPQAIAKAAPQLDAFKNQLAELQRNPTTRNDPNTLRSINSSIQHISRTISDNEFDTTPSLKNQYTQSHVDAYNQSLDKAASLGVPDTFKSLIDAFKVSTPQDLYFQTRKQVLEPKLMDSVTRILARAQRNELSAANGVTNQAATNDFLSKAAIGGPAQP